MSDAIGENVLHVQYRDKPAVYNCFMAFVKDGGLFVPQKLPPGPHPYAHLGAPLFLLVELPESPAPFMVSGKVAWINYGKRPGVGVRLTGDEWGRKLVTAVQNLLVGNLRSVQPTFTI